MLRSANSLVKAVCLILPILTPVTLTSTAYAGGEVIRPVAVKSDDAETRKPEPAKLDVIGSGQSSGEVIRVVNAGKAVASVAEEDDKPAAKKKSLRHSRGTSSKSAPAIARSSTNYAELIRAAAKKHGVPLEIAQAVVRIESNFNPRARGSHGEVGLMQIKPATARGLGYRGTTQALYDPKTNLEWGMRYLAGAHQRASGDVCGTILRYNAGHFAKRMNARSRSYCSQVKQLIASS